jgi:hypothetical protein
LNISTPLEDNDDDDDDIKDSEMANAEVRVDICETRNKRVDRRVKIMVGWYNAQMRID